MLNFASDSARVSCKMGLTCLLMKRICQGVNSYVLEIQMDNNTYYIAEHPD